MTDWLPLVGTVIGAIVAVSVQTLSSRREDRREKQRWAREESRQWLHHRRELYAETALLQYQWLQAIQSPDTEEVAFHEKFRELLAPLELLASTQVRDAAHNVLAALENLQSPDKAPPPTGAARSLMERAIIQVTYLNHLMRADLGVRDDPEKRDSGETNQAHL